VVCTQNALARAHATETPAIVGSYVFSPVSVLGAVVGVVRRLGDPGSFGVAPPSWAAAPEASAWGARFNSRELSLDGAHEGEMLGSAMQVYWRSMKAVRLSPN
jgi:hypothetical protein